MPDSSVDPLKWPFEALVTLGENREYLKHARANPDGTVTVLRFEPPGGFVEHTLGAEGVQLRERPEDKERKWLALFDSIYGSR